MKIKLILPLLLISVWAFSQKYKYRDDFKDNRNQWTLGKDAQTERTIENGVFTIHNFATQSNFWSIWNVEKPIKLNPEKNYRIKIKTWDESPDNGENKDNAIGIRFGVTKAYRENNKWVNNTFYAFSIDKQGNPQIYKRTFPEKSVEKVGTILEKGMGTTSHSELVIIKKGKSFSFYSGSKKVAEIEINDSEALENIGFFLIGKVIMKIDVLEIKEIK